MDLFSEIVNESQLLTELRKDREKDVIYAINHMLRARISYSDEKGRKGKKERFIYPVAFGLTKSGNPAVRAFQTAGSTKRGVPKWKLFRFDRIFAWSNGKRSYREYADKLKALGFNISGDLGMTKIYAIAPIAKSNVMVTSPENSDVSEPVNKDDIAPTTDLQNPAKNHSDKYYKASDKRNIDVDNDKQDVYIGTDNKNRLPIDAPKTEPFVKTQNNNVKTKPEVNTLQNMSVQITEPVQKTSVSQPTNEPSSTERQENNVDDEFKNKVNNLMQRMDNLNKNDEENGNI